MAKAKPPFPFDSRAFDLVNEAPFNPNAAVAALLLAADYMRRGEKLPCSLADFLADAIETAMLHPTRLNPASKGDKGKALLIALRLKAKNKREVNVRGHEVYYFMKQKMEGLIDKDGKFRFEGSSGRKMLQSQAAEEAARKFRISESSAKRIFSDMGKNERKLGPQERQVFSYYLDKLIGARL